MKPVERTALRDLEKAQTPSKDTLNALLFEAARKGWAEVVHELLRRGVDPNAKRNEDHVLLIASRFGADYPDVVQMLVDFGANPNAAKVMACCGVKTLPLLLIAGGCIDGNLAEWNPLLYAIKARTDEDKALALIGAGANVNVADVEGTTPLMAAVSKGRRKVFEALLKTGAETLAVDKNGRSVLRHALELMVDAKPAGIPSQQRQSGMIVKRLRDGLPAQPEDLLILDIVLGNLKEIDRRLKAGLDPNTLIPGAIGYLGVSQQSLLALFTSQGGLVEILRNPTEVLSAENFDLNADGCSLLMWAVAAGQLRMIERLLKAGADPKFTNQDGATAQRIAEQKKDSMALKLLNSHVA